MDEKRDPRTDPQPGDVLTFDGPIPCNKHVLGFTGTGRVRVRTTYNGLAPLVSAMRPDKWRAMATTATVITRAIDLQSCEYCERQFDIAEMVMHGDLWVCPRCDAEWRKTFDACEHDWEPYTDHMGDPGKVCRKCSGFVAGDTMIAASSDGKVVAG